MAEVTAQVKSSVSALMQEFNIISQNLANANTVGYKKRSGAFDKMLEKNMEQPKDLQPSGVKFETSMDFSQGNMVYTGAPLDLALGDKGFFVVETAKGPLYTRNGVFHLNERSQLVDARGRIVAGQGGAINVPNTVDVSKINVSTDGSIKAGDIAIGKFQVVNFGDDEDKLIPAGDSCFMMSDSNVNPKPAANIAMKQGFQESSNVNMLEELTNMIMVTRLYEANMKLLSKKSEATNNLLSVAMG
jgi:flagellar basal-body rod protein FlgF